MTSPGAARVFDYHDEDVVAAIVEALRGKAVMGAFSIGAGSVLTCMDVLAQCQGRKFVANCAAPIPFDAVMKGDRPTLGILFNAARIMLGATAALRSKSRRLGVTAKFFDASSVVDNEVGRYIYQDLLAKALAAGRFRPAPPPRVVGTGLQYVQTAFDIRRRGVSASKIVVALE